MKRDADVPESHTSNLKLKTNDGVSRADNQQYNRFKTDTDFQHNTFSLRKAPTFVLSQCRVFFWYSKSSAQIQSTGTPLSESEPCHSHTMTKKISSRTLVWNFLQGRGTCAENGMSGRKWHYLTDAIVTMPQTPRASLDEQTCVNYTLGTNGYSIHRRDSLVANTYSLWRIMTNEHL